ncbi:uncharacterized protein LOC119445794 isoform X2 [Dermacentor silvarum]|uniref:uncharacterized protein LOC119445794 isoform X2 n=1 Tax=Dermacentor silvarum TaxID=543639 RepID=UPI002100F8BC|nr:uncharacterized protein LOC119445794 isoform X2 [Dermacentor silvarum]
MNEREKPVAAGFEHGRLWNEPPFQAVLLHPRKAEKVHSSRSLPGRSTDFITSHGFSPQRQSSHENVSSTDSSNVHVQISDIAGDEDIVAITYFLKICKSTILKPYSVILQLVAWRKFRKDNPTRHHLSWRIMNVLYPAIILMLLLFYAALQGLACPGRLEFKTMQATALRNSTKIVPRNVTPTPDYFWDDYDDYTTTQSYEVQSLGELPLCQHRLTLYILPSLLQVIAFLYGSYMFRIIGVDEELYAIMEKVFLQSSAYFTERIIITVTRRFLLAGVVWTLMQIAVQILYNLALETEEQLMERAFSKLPEWKTMVLITLRILGQLAMILVEMAVVLNYCTQCEMIIIYLRGVALRLREKRITIREGMHVSRRSLARTSTRLEREVTLTEQARPTSAFCEKTVCYRTGAYETKLSECALKAGP